MILVLASSNGYTSFYNILGNNIFNINPKTVSQNPHILEAGDAIASTLFLPNAKNQKWTYEFILITYSGLLRSYYISTTGFTANYDFSFGNFYKNGINAVVYDEKRHLFYVAGNMITHKLTVSILICKYLCTQGKMIRFPDSKFREITKNMYTYFEYK